MYAACTEVASYRATPIIPITAALDGYADIAQNKWANWRLKQRLDHQLPSQFSEILTALIDFADPVLIGSATGKTWTPLSKTWT